MPCVRATPTRGSPPDELEDIIGTTAQAFIGLTAQCARCHDHKFDPITQTDYYRLAAVFASATRPTHKSKATIYGIVSEPPGRVHVLRRGNLSSPLREVGPSALACVPQLNGEFGEATQPDSQRRLRLAEWIVDERNALAARVIVNRVWGWVFGQGLVPTPNDFGVNGERPSHPELLDWLATDFIESGRSVKRLIRQLVLTRAYRQSSLLPAERRGASWRPPSDHPSSLMVDPTNRLLSRHSPRRLEAEEVRDAMLSVSGQLHLKLGGPGYQLFDHRENAGTLYWPVDKPGAEFLRRSIYRMVVRGAEDTFLAGLDCPDPSNTTPRRLATTTATQALNLLNNSFVERMSGHFARRLQAEADEAQAQIRRSYELAFGRAPSMSEVARAEQFIGHHGLKAWCRVVLNASEFLYLN